MVRLVSVEDYYPRLDETKYCFVCGLDNPKGLKLECYVEDENAVVASYIAPDYLCGFKFKKPVAGFIGFLHGGMHCALLDCLGLWTFIALRKKPAVSTEFSVKLLKPVFVGEKMYLRGEIMSEKDDVVIVKAEIRNSRKELCTVSEIRLRVLSEELLKMFTGKEE